MLGCAVGLGCMLILLGRVSSAFESGTPSSGRSTSAVPPDSVPHPWLADIPPALSRLVTVGKVRFAVDDDLLQRVGKAAVTQTAMTNQYPYRYDVKPLASQGDGVRARIMVQFGKSHWSLEHTIVFRSDFQPARPWETDLMRHEFDHVAISSDPRLLKLLGWLEARKLHWDVTADDPESLEAMLVSEIEQQMRLRREALEAVVRAYYVRLDAVTHDGSDAVPRRAAFFRQLYTQDDLRDMQFPYWEEVAATLKSVPMAQVDRHYWLKPEATDVKPRPSKK